MGDLYVFIMRATNGVMLATFYAAFLAPKINRFPKRVVFALFGITYFIVQSMMPKVLLLFGFGVSTGVPYHVLSFFIFIILLVSVFLLSLIFFQANLGMQTFLISSFFAIQEICFFIVHAINNLLGNAGKFLVNTLHKSGTFTTVEDYSDFYNNFLLLGIGIQLLLYATILFLSLKMIIKSFSYKNQSFSLTELLYLVLPCLSGLLLVSIIRAIIYKTNADGYLEMYAGVPYAQFLIPLSGFVFLFSLIAAVRLFQKLVALHNEQRQRIILEKQTQLLQEQVQGIDDVYTEIRGMRHDMKSHIFNIKLLIKSISEGNINAKDELEQYLNQFGEALDKFEFTFQTGNSISDVIIHQKYKEATEKGIEFSVDFAYPAQMNLDAYDLAVILNNALENAIEACSNMRRADSFIKLYCYAKGEMFFIEVENSFTGRVAIREDDELPSTSKSDKELHGMGLSNIQRCARKYYGDINFQIRKEKSYSVFHLIIMLQSKE